MDLNTGTKMSKLVKEGTCLGAVMFPGDFLTEAANFSIEPIDRRSGLFEVQLTSVTANDILDPGHLERPVNISLPVWGNTLDRSRQIQCVWWLTGVGWSPSECETSPNTVTMAGQEYQQCQCYHLGYYT
uniref:GPS domain-containing protein n=1 Tax=Timema poppense TaxID=170557 RepID=A0A7R9DUK0_TIMPO|nr:unnamed protein product [Timema poppensis]